MDQELKKELEEIRRLMALNYTEIQHLKKRLYRHLEISEDDIHDYRNSLHEYLENLDRKNRILMRDFSL